MTLRWEIEPSMDTGPRPSHGRWMSVTKHAVTRIPSLRIGFEVEHCCVWFHLGDGDLQLRIVKWRNPLGWIVLDQRLSWKRCGDKAGKSALQKVQSHSRNAWMDRIIIRTVSLGEPTRHTSEKFRRLRFAHFPSAFPSGRPVLISPAV